MLVFVGSAVATADTAATQTTASRAYETGNLIIVVAKAYTAGSAVSGVTDSAGNTYTQALRYAAGGAACATEIWYAANITGGSVTVTVDWGSVGASNRRTVAHEYRGGATSSVVDTTATATGNSAAPSVTFSAARAGDLAFGVESDQGGTVVAGTNYTLRTSGLNTFAIDRINAPSGSQTADWTISSGARQWDALVVVFKSNGIPGLTATGAFAEGTTSPLVPTLPANVAGDLLVVEVHSSTSDTTVPTHSTPAGYTLVASASNASGTRRARVSVYVKKSGGSESNPSFTVTPTGVAVDHRARAHVVKGWNDTGTITAALDDATTATAADSSTLAFSGFTTTGAKRLAFASVAQADDTATGITNNNSYLDTVADYDSATGSDGYSSQAMKEVASASSQDVTFTFTSGGSISTAGVLFGILPVATSTTYDLTGTPSAVFAPAGALTVTRFLTGAPSAVFAPAGSPQAERKLSGAPSAVFAPAGSPQAVRNLTGSPSAVFTPAGSLRVERFLTGAPSAAFAPAGNPDVQRLALLMSGAPSAVFTAAGELSVQRTIALAGTLLFTFIPAGGPFKQPPRLRYRPFAHNPTWWRRG